MKNRVPRLAILAAVIVALAACNTIGRIASRQKDPLAAGDTAKEAAVELHGIPSVNELPPIVPGAGGRVSVAGVAGPRKPRVAWDVALQFTPPSLIDVISTDGTVYVSGYGQVGAARDGKLAWAYQTRAARPFLANDGRLWFGRFCLNRNGEGGRLPASFLPPPNPNEERLLGCSGNGRAMRGFGFDVPLDYECTRPQAKLGPDGIGYVATDAPDIRAVTSTGAVAWKLQTPCAAQTLLVGPGGRVFFSCKDNSIHFIENGALRWAKPGDGEIQEGNVIMPSTSFLGVMDRDGATYFVDRPATGGTHIHAMSAAGEILWTVETADFGVSSIQFDGQGRLFLSGQRGMGQRLVCLSD